jgi:dipeptidyl aminopeptidase/acylaminoacyl peptidase
VSVAWSPDDELLATASIDGTARIWSSRTGDLLAVLDHQQKWVLSVAFSPDGRRIATGRADGVTTIWELPRFAGGRAGLARIVQCRVPYDIRDERVVERPRDRAACAPVHAAQ